MNREQIIALARQAEGEEQPHGMWRMHVEDLERFAALVAAHEREACIKVCEQLEQEWEDAELWASFKAVGFVIDAIRSRT